MKNIKIYFFFLAFMIITTGLRYIHLGIFNFPYAGEFSPILISIIFILLNKRDSFKMLSLNKFEAKPLLFSILAIICAEGIDFIFQYKFQTIRLPVIEKSLLIHLAILAFTYTIIVAGFEEVGWRGYLTSKIIQYKLSWAQLIVITGIIWSIWHIPTHYIQFKHFYVQFPLYILICFELGIIMTYLRIRTNSVIPAIIFHAVSSILYETFFRPGSNYDNLYFLAFPGIFYILSLMPFSIYYYIRGNKIYSDNYLKT